MEIGTPASHPAPADLRPLDLAGLLDRSVDLYRSNFLLFTGIGALLYFPFGLAGLLAALAGELVHAVLSMAEGLILMLAWPLVAGALVIRSPRHLRALLLAAAGSTFHWMVCAT